MFVSYPSYCSACHMAAVWQPNSVWAERIGGCTGLLRGPPAHLNFWSQPQANNQAFSCMRVMGAGLPTEWMSGEDMFIQSGRQQQEQEEEQDLLWRQFFLDPAMWWDNRRGKKSSRSPDFSRKGSGEVLWLNSMFKPAWVDEQLVCLDMQMGHGASPSKSSSLDKPGPGTSARLEGLVTPATVSTLCQQGKLTEAVGALESLAQVHCRISQSLLYALLKMCAAKKDLVVGRRVHDLAVKLGYESDTFLGNHILRMYVCGGRLEEAMEVFTRVDNPDAFMWCSIISAHAKHKRPKEAIQLYHNMRSSGVEANAHVFVAALQACAFAADLESGRKVHCDVLHSDIPPDLFVGNCLVDMYAKCGELGDARRVFHSLARKDVVTWTALIAGYANRGLGQEALDLYGQMEQEGVAVGNHVTFACLLKACVSTGAIQRGRQLHAQIVKRGQLGNALVANSLVDMYAKFGELEEARRVFDSLPNKDVVTWTVVISGYASHGFSHEALVLYEQMEQEELIVADHVIVVCLLKACASAGALQMGRRMHSQIVKRGQLDNLMVANSLVDMYAKCGELEDAHLVFDSLTTKDVVTWTALIAGYVNHGPALRAFVLYGQMEQEGRIVGNHVTFACLLKACISTGALHMGRQLHSQIVARGQLDNILVGTSLVDMYAKCGELEEARQVFDSLRTKEVATWTALIAGYAQQGLGDKALALYGQMEQEGLIVADDIAFVCLLKACASAGALQKGRQLHSQVVERGYLDNVLVGNSLVDMYAKCGELEDALRVFDSLATKDVVTWTALIVGYANHGLGQQALVLYEQFEEEGLIVADEVTFACLLKACASAGALQQGKQLHSKIVERGQLDNVLVGTSLVDMYAKCGELEEARRVFNSLSTKGVVTWNALISGFGTCDEGQGALACFEEMFVSGVEPDGATFTSLLVACSHAGLVNEGRKLFASMVEQHGITPTMEHFNCMTDLLGRAGRLDEAENMLLSCESQGNVVGLTSFLNSCKSHGDIERAASCFERLVGLEPHGASAYVLMANVYADAGMWTEVDRIETQRRAAGAYKKPAVAGIEVKRQVHTFVVGESRHDIILKSESTNARLKQKGGHVPHTRLVLKPLSEKEKEDELCGHAEKLALAFGLLSTPSGTSLVVTKNLRMCSDCHSSTEVMSRVEKREIVVRDSYRVHRFTAGCCSCNGRP